MVVGRSRYKARPVVPVAMAMWWWMQTEIDVSLSVSVGGWAACCLCHV